MKIVCPCCLGKGEIEEVAPVHLSPMQLKIYKAVRATSYGVTGFALLGRIYGDRDDGGPECAAISLHVQVKRMNERLAAVKQKVSCGRGKLYRLERDVV